MPSVSRLESRVRRLEARLTDKSGLRPHSAEWLDHWLEKLTLIVTGGVPGRPSSIPLEVWDAIDFAKVEAGQATDNE